MAVWKAPRIRGSNNKPLTEAEKKAMTGMEYRDWTLYSNHPNFIVRFCSNARSDGSPSNFIWYVFELPLIVGIWGGGFFLASLIIWRVCTEIIGLFT